MGAVPAGDRLSRRGARGLRRDEGGQLLLISGVVITVAFLLTALTLSQVSSLERQAATEQPTSLLSEWRFLHDRLGTNLETAITTETTNDSFETTTFPTIAATFRNIEAEKGFDTIIRLATHATVFNMTEHLIVTPTYGTGGPYTYDRLPLNSETTFSHAADDDLTDGLIWEQPCPATGGPGGCIVGVLVFVHLTDGVSSMEEVMVFRVNEA